MGDFNAPHTAWGYHTTTKKGARVHDTAQQHRLTLWNDPLQTTRVGNSVSRDTNPDLTFTLNVRSAEWDRLPETLGSDHHIIQLTVAHTRKPARIGTAQITEWKLFRDDLNVETTIENIDDWMKNVLDTAERHTKRIQLNEEAPAVDTHLLHLWEARRSLLRRWKRQKLNKQLKKRIALLTEQAQEYAERLGRQNCGPTRTQQRQNLCRLVHNYAGSEENLLREVQKKLCGDPPITTTAHDRAYSGKPNPELDEPFTEAELFAALSTLTRNTSPGKDRIINKHLRNLPQQASEALLQYFNKCWESGEIPATWKHSEITMIPKPNKPFSIENLRPISLTSCVGKLFEHMVHNRLTPYLEDKGYFPNTMFGFRQHLSTQDIFLLLKEDLIDHLSTKSKSSIVAIDIKGAFDNVSHDAILCNLEHLDCGSRIYNYVRNFLTHRTATVGIYNLRSDTFRLPSRGSRACGEVAVVEPDVGEVSWAMEVGEDVQMAGTSEGPWAEAVE
ncbi:uncharacterized protein LOC119395058 [Rhipicephalus sanguineus]|uniref:uncharacterized protein LOC119395058 n=1 Tax=Rhipicephalus sanguineus TaxID=34632 RepID=UPI0018941F96|nr:uncharacterized protein LOC119395058 [Rhipicephalus sanguineus]